MANVEIVATKTVAKCIHDIFKHIPHSHSNLQLTTHSKFLHKQSLLLIYTHTHSHTHTNINKSARSFKLCLKISAFESAIHS